MTRFTPTPERARDFRATLGRFSTGVTVVTCASARGPLGITVNSFASVSLDPPLVLWSAARSSARHDAFCAAERFAIHVLGAGQEDLASAFATRADAFDTVEWSESPEGLPLLATCAARFDCTRDAVHPGGDHSILVGRVEGATLGPITEPLVFHLGRFGGFAELE